MTGVLARQLSHQPGPNEIVAHPRREGTRSLSPNSVCHGLGLFVEVFVAGRLREYLCFAGVLEEIHAEKGDGAVGADRQGAVVTQHQQGFVANVSHDALTLIKVKRDALVVVVGQIVAHGH